MSLTVKILIDFEEYLRLKRFVEEFDENTLRELLKEQYLQGSKVLIDYEVYEKLKKFEMKINNQIEN